MNKKPITCTVIISYLLKCANADFTRSAFFNRNNALRPPATVVFPGRPLLAPQGLKTTVLTPWHVSHGATMSDTGGYWMPLHYGNPSQEALNTRYGVSVFDESHMGLIDIRGEEAAGFIDRLSSPNVDEDGIRPFDTGDVQYRYLFDDDGNMIDDIEVVRIRKDHFRLVVNAANTERVKDWLLKGSPKKYMKKSRCRMSDMRDAPVKKDRRIILALQGTNGAQDILQQLSDFNLNRIDYFRARHIYLNIGGEKLRCLVQRSGYTNEDGFEIHIDPDKALGFWEKVIELGARPAGMESRDILRQEAGDPLFYHEWLPKGGPMPWEFRFRFAVNLKNRGKFKKTYIGKQALIEKEKKSKRRLVGIKVLDRISIPQNGNKVFDGEGKKRIGFVTSGCRSPYLNTTIGLVYINKKYARPGRAIKIVIDEGKAVEAKVVKAPFINHVVSDRVRDPRERAPFYLPGTDAERKKKLRFIKKAFEKRFGKEYKIDSVDDLFGPLQKLFYTEPLSKKFPELASPMSRRELFGELYKLSVQDVQTIQGLISFLGAGFYDELYSEVAAYLSSKPEYYGPYKPYQSEISQGSLRFMFLYASVMAKFFGMDAVNASLYDGASALAEGVRMAHRATRKRKVIAVGAINPRHKAALDTFAKSANLEIIYIAQDKKTGRVDIEALKKKMDRDVASVVVQQPNFLGILETEIDKIAEIARRDKALLHIHSNDPHAFVQVKTPGNYGADIVTAQGQAFVGGPYYGGNNLGIIGCARRLLIHMPGHIIGKTHDAEGDDAFALALTAREQHVSKEEATSPICTNAALNALCAVCYMLDMGQSGLEKITGNCHRLAMSFANKIEEIPGFRVYGSGPIFREVVVESPIPVDKLKKKLLEEDIDIGPEITMDSVSKSKNLVQVTFTARHTFMDLEKLIKALNKVAVELRLRPGPKPGNLVEIPKEIKREGPFDIPDIPEDLLIEKIGELGKLNFAPLWNPCLLGTCTVMYNPFINEMIVRLEAFIRLHPEQSKLPQGVLKIVYDLGLYLQEITGMDAFSANPAAGSQGEYAGLTSIFRYFESIGESPRKIVIATDASHGTNLANAAIAKPENVKIVRTNKETGRVDKTHLRRLLREYNGRVAAIMCTEPNTLGLWEDIKNITRIVRKQDSKIHMYMDGANLNAILARIKAGELDVDVIQLNLHKTFSTPHGGGGPGAGPVCAKRHLAPFLPYPRVVAVEEAGQTVYKVVDDPNGVHVGDFLGNIGVLIRAYCYIRALGEEGLRAASGDAVLNANYLMAKLMYEFDIPLAAGELRMHEFVISLKDITGDTGITTHDFAKALQDYGIIPPTIEFPIKNALMIEPTQSMSLADLDRVADAFIEIKEMAYRNPQYLKDAPHKTPVKRVDDDEVHKSDVQIISDDIRGILGLGRKKLKTVKPEVIPTLHEYEEAVSGWEAAERQLIPNQADEEWLSFVEIDGKRCAVVGLTHHTVDELNKDRAEKDAISKVNLPDVGTEVYAGLKCGSLTTSKGAQDINSPVTGRVIKINEFAADNPFDVNHDPLARGWLMVVELKEEPVIKDGRVIIHQEARVAGGVTEKDAEGAEGITQAQFPLSRLGTARVMGKTSGFVWISFDDETRDILGAHIVGEHAEELIRVIDLAGRLEGAKIEDLADLVYAHPTLAEAIGEAAESALGRSIHLMPAKKPRPKKKGPYDLLIVGAGPGGYAGAIRAAQLGLKVAMVEKDDYGGICLNKGCIPTKAILEYIKQHQGDEKIDLEDLRANVEDIVGGLRNGVETLLRANGIEVIKGAFDMKKAERDKQQWKIPIGDRNYNAKNLILAMGSRPASLPGLTIDHENIIDSDDALLLKEVPKKLTIIGAGAIGLEFAMIYKALGSKEIEVTVVEMRDQILPDVFDKDVAKKLQRKLEKLGIKFELGRPFNTNKLPKGKILVAVGRAPNSEGLESVVATTRKGEVIVDDQYRAKSPAETYHPNLFAVGDLIAMPKQLAHKASKEAKITVENIVAGKQKGALNYQQIPAVVFTNPEAATVGLTEALARAANKKICIRKFDYPDKDNKVKAVIDRESGAALGFQIIGPAAPYAIAEMTLAVRMGAKLKDFLGDNVPESPVKKMASALLRAIASSA